MPSTSSIPPHSLKRDKKCQKLKKKIDAVHDAQYWYNFYYVGNLSEYVLPCFLEMSLHVQYKAGSVIATQEVVRRCPPIHHSSLGTPISSLKNMNLLRRYALECAWFLLMQTWLLWITSKVWEIEEQFQFPSLRANSTAESGGAIFCLHRLLH